MSDACLKRNELELYKHWVEHDKHISLDFEWLQFALLLNLLILDWGI